MGETGTSKELTARAIHDLSSRRGRAFVKLNVPPSPLGFGHEKGAFTGAIAQKTGRFELANKAILVLDEIGDIPREFQAKLLRVLQDQEFERLGSNRTHKVDVRLIAATHRDLSGMVKHSTFREDLYYRLKVFPINVPPLRQRAEDIPKLVWHFTEVYARRMNKRINEIPFGNDRCAGAMPLARKANTRESRGNARNILTPEGTRWQYTHGVGNPESVLPESYTLDTALLERRGNKDIQLDLFLDHASNVKLYPAFQDYFRKAKPPLLAIWGKNDPFFVPAGAKAFRKSIPDARVEFLDTGHFATETHVVEIAAAMKEFLAANDVSRRTDKRDITMSSFAQSRLTSRTTASKSACAHGTIVLVHGAWADGSCWRNIILPLRQEGLQVMCAPIPLTSLAEDIDAFQRWFERTRGPVLLVGHAYGAP